MDPLSTTITSISFITSCLTVGRELLKKYEIYKNTNHEVAEALIKLRVLWNKSEIQMEFLQTHWDSLERSLQQDYHNSFTILNTKLQNADRLLDDVTGASAKDPQVLSLLKIKGKLRRGRYVLSVKESLENTFTEIQDWHALFDPSWYLMAKLASTNLETHLNMDRSPPSSPIARLSSLMKSARDLAKPTNQSAKDISSVDFLDTRCPIIGSSAALAQFHDNNRSAIVDSVVVSPFADVVTTIKDVKALSKALTRMDPSTFGLLRCCGVIQKSRPSGDKGLLGFDIVFDIPNHLSNPQSLRNLLSYPQPSLNSRLAISRQLATSVLYLFTAGFVHKNIRPETILVFTKENSTDKEAYLVGFENFRMSDTATLLIGDGTLERNLYRHPLRQGNHPQDTYKLQHDMYSLGVCFLEIGLWIPFIKQDDSQGICVPTIESGLGEIMNISDERKRASNIKKRLLTLVGERLPAFMGDRFTDIVLNCLTLLDGTQYPDQFETTESGDVEIGIQFIENILGRLQEIAI